MPRTDHERNAAIWKAYCRFTPVTKIARDYELTEQRIYQIIKDWREAVPVPDKVELVRRELEFLTQAAEMAMEIAQADPAPATAGGDVLYDPRSGEVVADHSGRMAATRLAIDARRELRKLLGLDSPTKIDTTNHVKYSVDGVDVGEELR